MYPHNTDQTMYIKISIKFMGWHTNSTMHPNNTDYSRRLDNRMPKMSKKIKYPFSKKKKKSVNS